MKKNVYAAELSVKHRPPEHSSSSPELNDQKHQNRKRHPDTIANIKPSENSPRMTIQTPNPFAWGKEDDLEKSSFSEFSEMKTGTLSPRNFGNGAPTGLVKRPRPFHIELKHQAQPQELGSPPKNKQEKKPAAVNLRDGEPSKDNSVWAIVLLSIALLILSIELVSSQL